MRTVKDKKRSFSNPELEILAVEMREGFTRIDSRFESMQREMDIRFDAVDIRFDANEKRFDSIQREMNIRFESVDHKFSVVYWMMGTGFALVLSALGVIMKFVVH